MIAILFFIAFVIVGDVFAVLIASLFESISETAGLLVFFGLFIGVFGVAWMLAVHVTERFFITEQRS